jgi:hypothetical protein
MLLYVIADDVDLGVLYKYIAPTEEVVTLDV